ncbi:MULTISPECIES: DUF2065 domain-containing protein [Shewanella]|uniref:DUF2065 domain-containing protein n=1 Tax=Shewanella TaxID=22 RepID=UPI00048DF8B2|nr:MULTISPECIES: DUF2065 domain-containing protein [Shewanella]AXQ14622.1 hypothetical protein BS332_10295 [Shewanella algae]AYV12315.1 DUF2065 domain-containing protein [Shewanella algae]MBC8794534.1 DUF2065 domain-containing protein [Shewanella algae]MBO2559580.1 DUF2065 domain-containing protein [Shewanella algae]MBO2576557.1 DUF2065 domain-containing protein [Shewanella algae]
MSWQLLLMALGLVLILEGVGPLLFPNRWRRYLLEVASQPTVIMQRLGGVLVVAGIVILIIFS